MPVDALCCPTLEGVFLACCETTKTTNKACSTCKGKTTFVSNLAMMLPHSYVGAYLHVLYLMLYCKHCQCHPSSLNKELLFYSLRRTYMTSMTLLLNKKQSLLVANTKIANVLVFWVTVALPLMVHENFVMGVVLYSP